MLTLVASVFQRQSLLQQIYGRRCLFECPALQMVDIFEMRHRTVQAPKLCRNYFCPQSPLIPDVFSVVCVGDRAL